MGTYIRSYGHMNVCMHVCMYACLLYAVCMHQVIHLLLYTCTRHINYIKYIKIPAIKYERYVHLFGHLLPNWLESESLVFEVTHASR